MGYIWTVERIPLTPLRCLFTVLSLRHSRVSSFTNSHRSPHLSLALHTGTILLWLTWWNSGQWSCLEYIILTDGRGFGSHPGQAFVWWTFAFVLCKSLGMNMFRYLFRNMYECLSVLTLILQALLCLRSDGRVWNCPRYIYLYNTD